ncbi:MAG: lytic transglycosylase domain-containing protein [Acidobacteriaceae bacterium]
MQIRYIARTWLGTPCLLATLLCTPVLALQRVTLRNGFSYDCARYEALDSSHIRLFLTPKATDFIDLSRQSIVSIETLPDPIPTPSAPATKSGAPGPASRTQDSTTANVPQLLSAAGQQHHIDAALLASIVHAESNYQPRAISRTGAQGLMQLMPGTAHQLGVDDAFRPDENIAGGTTYLDQLLDRYDPNNNTYGLELALAAYNAGPAAVDRYHGIPPYRETRAYVVRVLKEFKRRKLALEHPAAHTPLPNQTIASLGVH